MLRTVGGARVHPSGGRGLFVCGRVRFGPAMHGPQEYIGADFPFASRVRKRFDLIQLGAITVDGEDIRRHVILHTGELDGQSLIGGDNLRNLSTEVGGPSVCTVSRVNGTRLPWSC